jgi:hypothetical protein
MRLLEGVKTCRGISSNDVGTDKPEGESCLRLSLRRHSCDYPPMYKLSMYNVSVVSFTGLHFI